MRRSIAKIAAREPEFCRETLRLTRQRKQMGVGVVLEDIQAQQELLKVRTDLVTIVTELNQQQYALLHSVGTALRRP